MVHLEILDECYVTKLSSRINLNVYAQKIASKAYVFTARYDELLVGVVATYFNPSPRYSFCTNVAVLPA